jgi:hypothetical protein
MRKLRGVTVTLLLLATSAQNKPFAFAGISLRSDLKTIAARYPHSSPDGDYLRLEPTDIHDHIAAIGISGTGPNRRARISFELQGASGALDYPGCRAIEEKLVGDFGSPQVIRRFSEEASLRADRVWQSKHEELTLICFKGARGVYWAEAVQITPR